MQRAEGWSASSGAIRSELADDTELRELAELFVSELGERVAALERAWNEREIATLRTLAHQLKGASGGYGFPPISASAAKLEHSIDTCAAVEDIHKELNKLIDLCRRATV